MEVTRHNLQELMPTIRDAIDHASFVAVDCEMTGLFDYEPKPWYLDDMQTRYEDVAANAQKFGLIQIGLAAFAPSLTGLGWVAKTFNFYLFPCALEGTDRRFLSQASSLEFLSGCGFDFNKCIRHGVPYMTAVARDARLARVAREASAKERASQQPLIQLTAQRDIDFKEDFLARVRDWLASNTEEALLLPSSNSFQRAVQHQELRRPQFGAPDPPGFHVEVVKGPSGYNQLRLVKADPEVAAAARAAATSKAQADIHAAAGFTAVLEMLRGAGKPVVGHNAFFDLAFILSSFATQLPPSLRAFKELVRAWFPAGFWDTKHLACQLQAAQPAAAPEDTSLGALYADLEARAAGGVASDPGEGGLIQTAPLPTVGHSVTFDRYDFAGASMLAHEAGYDAFMTGAVFARLAVLLGGAETVQAALPALAALRGRLNVTRSDYAYINLEGPDPEPRRPKVLWVSGFEAGSLTGGSLARRVNAHQLGSTRSTVLRSGCDALVELFETSDVQEALRKLRQSLKPWRVDTYAAYAAHRETRLLEEEKEWNAAGARVGSKRPRETAGPSPSEKKERSMCAVM